jgi:hypothetical protein
MKTEKVVLPSGVVVLRYFAGDGALVRETHSRAPQIAVTARFEGGKRISEVYVVNGKPVDAKIYSQHRLGHPDLPAPHVESDAVAQHKQIVRDEHDAWVLKFQAHKPEPDIAGVVDAMAMRKISDSSLKIGLAGEERPSVLIGDFSPQQSKELIESLYTAGAVAIWLTDADERTASFGGMVLRLPGVARSSLFELCDSIVKMAGYEADFDNGQQYMYIRLQ